MTPQQKAAATRARRKAVEQLDGVDRQVLDRVPTMTNREIADDLGLSEAQVTRVVARLRTRLGVGSRWKLAQLVR